MGSAYTFMLDLYRQDGRPVGQSLLDPDWTPALEWLHFEGIREGRLPPLMAVNLAPGSYQVEPVWHPQCGQPRVSGFRVTLPANGSGEIARDIPITYVRGAAERASAVLVEKGLLQRGDTFQYVVSAFADPPQVRAAQTLTADFSVEDVVQPLPLRESSMAALLPAEVDSRGKHTAGDVAVFVQQTVVDEALALAERAGDVETGGILVGFLHRDASIPDIFVEVTAQIAAPHTNAATTKLTFTPDTWTAVRAALALRKRGELMVGWWHYHPDFCRLRECPEEKRRQCTASSAFFSSEDVALHTALFARAYNTALLISDSAATGLTASLFGWRQGMVAARGFYIIPACRTWQPATTQRGAGHRNDAGRRP